MKYLMKVELEIKNCNQGDASAKDGELFLKINKINFTHGYIFD
ncbi:MAG: hypothetical protein WAR99_05260 [Saprospiraceae bacterium]|jgi:hypothetical protein